MPKEKQNLKLYTMRIEIEAAVLAESENAARDFYYDVVDTELGNAIFEHDFLDTELGNVIFEIYPLKTTPMGWRTSDFIYCDEDLFDYDMTLGEAMRRFKNG